MGLGRGDSIGRYLVLGLLGKGGMGEVYAAYDPELDRKVALKLLRAQAAAGVDPSEGRARLLREAQAIARLSDPNVVVVFDVGMFGERVFLAMEFVDGNTIGYWLQAQTRSWREVVRTFTAAGRGLASAHRAGLVHRDFKPDNVMITRDGQVRVMDFGLARSIDADGEAKPGQSVEKSGVVAAPVAAATVQAVAAANADWTEADVATRDLSTGAAPVRTTSPSTAFTAPLTMTGAMMGTPAYMAPEQFKGTAVDARSDQFSFCVALHEALYGVRPFEGKNIHDLTANVLAGKVRPAPAKARVPGWLRRIVLRGLRVDRAERFPSMEALLATLEKDPARARRRWAAAGAVAGLIAVMGAGLFRAEREKQTRCLGAETKLAGVWELPTSTGKGELSPRKEAIRRAFMATGKRYAADSFEVVRHALDRYVTDWTGMHRESCEATNITGQQSAEVLDLRTSCLQERFAEVRALTNIFGDASGDVVAKSVEAVQSIRAVEQCADIAVLRAVVKPPEDPRVRTAVADLRTQLADIRALASAGRYRRALESIQPVVAAARATKYAPVVSESLLALGAIEGELAEPGAERSYEDAYFLAEGARHDEVALEAADQLISVVGTNRSRYVEAERWSRIAEAILRRLGPGHDRLAAWRANNLAIVLDGHGESEKALALSIEALEIKTRAMGEMHSDVGLSLANVAYGLNRLGRTDEAIRRNERALQILGSTVGSEHPFVANTLANHAEFLLAAKRAEEARSNAERAVAVMKRELGSDHPDIAVPLMILGLGALEMGDNDNAIAALEASLRICESKVPAAARTPEVRFALARALGAANPTSRRAMDLAESARTQLTTDATPPDLVASVNRWISAHQSVGARLSMR